MKNYELYSGHDLVIADLIQRRRYQLLIHSCIYYHLNRNSVSDLVWDTWAKELVELQHNNPEISESVTLYEYFSDWDGSTGAFLPITEPWVISKAQKVLRPSVVNNSLEKPTNCSVIEEPTSSVQHSEHTKVRNLMEFMKL